MSSPVGPEAQEAALPFRVYGLEGRASTTDAAIADLRAGHSRHSEALSAQAITLARHEEQISTSHDLGIENKADIAALVTAVAALAERIAISSTRVAWVLVACTLTVVGSLITFIVTQSPG